MLRTAYLLRQRTPTELAPVPAEWQPLPQGPTYTDFKDFPQGAFGLACCVPCHVATRFAPCCFTRSR